MEGIEAIPKLVRALYRIVEELESRFPRRRFTLDGHIVGSIGEILAAYAYRLELLTNSKQGHDARTTDGRLVQIKATQAGAIGLRSQPQHLIVLKLNRDGLAEEVYNGPGHLAWRACGRRQKNGQRPISVSKLKQLMQSISQRQRLPPVAH